VTTNRALVVLLVAVALLLWLARGVLGPFIVAAVIAYAFAPVVSNGQRRLGWPRVAVVAGGYVIALVIIGILAWLVGGRVVSEITLLASSGPDSVSKLLRELLGTDMVTIAGQQITVADIAAQLEKRMQDAVSSPGDALHVAGVVGETLLQFILVLIVAFYLLVDGPGFIDHFVTVIPPDRRDRTVDLLRRIHVVLGKWLRGQIVLVALVSVVTYLFLGPVLHLPYALAIAVLTGILEVIPLVGPIAAAAIAAIDAFGRGGVNVALVVIVFYTVLRQVEDQLVMPVVIGRAVHLHPVVTIFAVLVGLSTYGALGGLLGVPVAAALNVVYRELYPRDESKPAEPTSPAAAPPPAAVRSRRARARDPGS
jgi:predicted PurR-regulated permease PerM